MKILNVNIKKLVTKYFKSIKHYCKKYFIIQHKYYIWIKLFTSIILLLLLLLFNINFLLIVNIKLVNQYIVMPEIIADKVADFFVNFNFLFQ